MCHGDQEETKYLRPSKTATPVRPAESASHPSSSDAPLQRAAACRSPRASARQHDTLVAWSVEPSGPSLPGWGLRAARFPHVMIIGTVQRRPCSWNETSGSRSVRTRHAGWACCSWSCCCLGRAVRDHDCGRDVDRTVVTKPNVQRVA
jgi:hypothetical protein